MNLVLKFYGFLCATSTFKINGIDACYEDFGDKCDRNPDEEQAYSCVNMQFTRDPSTQLVLEKYKISEEEYSEICEKLEEGLSFGSCCFCA